MTNDADRKRDVATAFGDAADGYRDGAVLKEGADLERLIDWTAGATRALDVATGAGHVAGALADRDGPRVVAADLSPAMVATATSEYDDLAVPDDPELAAYVDRIERLRDPGPAETYSRAQWRDWLESAGLTVEAVRETSRRLEVDAWLDRMDVPNERRREIRSLLADAPAELEDAFDFRYASDGEGERLESYRTPVVLVRATA